MKDRLGLIRHILVGLRWRVPATLFLVLPGLWIGGCQLLPEDDAAPAREEAHSCVSPVESCESEAIATQRLDCPQTVLEEWARSERKAHPRCAVARLQHILPALDAPDRLKAQAQQGLTLGLYEAAALPEALERLEAVQKAAEAAGPEAACPAHLSWRFRSTLTLKRPDALPSVVEDPVAFTRRMADGAVRTGSACGTQDEAKARVLRAQAARLEGDLLTQYDDLKTAIGLTAALTDSDDALNARFLLAELFHDLGDTVRADDEYQQVEALLTTHQALGHSHDTLHADLYNARGHLLRDQDRTSDAYLEFQAAWRLSAKSGEPDTTIEWVSSLGLAAAVLDGLERSDPPGHRTEPDPCPESRADCAERIPSLWKVLLAPPPSVQLLPRQRHLHLLQRARLLRLRQDPSGACSAAREVLEDSPEPEQIWRATLLLAELSRDFPVLQEAPSSLPPPLTLYQEAIQRIEQDYRTLADQTDDPRVLTLATTSQRWRLYEGWLEALLERWEENQRVPGDSSKSRPPISYPSGEWRGGARSAGRSPANFAGAARAESADVLLMAAERASSQSVAAELLTTAGGLEALAARSLHLDRLRTRLVQRPTGDHLRSLVPGDVTILLYQPLPRSGDVLLLEIDRERVRPHRIRGGPTLLARVEHIAALMDQQSPGAVPELASVGEALLGPVRARLQEPDRYVGFILNGALDRLPLAALRLQDRYLVERVVPFTLPNLGVLEALPRRRLPAETLRVLGLAYGVDAGAQELSWIEQAGLSVVRLEQQEATRENLLARAPGFDIVHLITHGESPDAPSRPGRDLAHAWTRRKYGRLAVSGGTLDYDDLSRSVLRAWLVVLSACRTGLGAREQRDFGVGALHKAGLVAGAEAVISSIWDVGSDATLELMRHFYAHLRTHGRARALAMAQRTLIQSAGRGSLLKRQLLPVSPVATDGGGGSSSPLDRSVSPAGAKAGLPFSAPFCWAGFVLTGRWE